ncbi:adenosylcobinamide-phosphate synthase CbiB [Abyssisolibacter fermentans]|uniref:adenosylcobinamide-phosphate synthase CbiB n=1 Tax=Abyssisolibacter fermentans TaxID=1766203 RepID=UPI000833414A|nr:adenosylcobinamide-phosphate synthase CbiB [Abyssisolibacter fermentans]
MEKLIVFLIAIFLDFILGDPVSWPHPIIYVGKLISYLEKKIRKQNIISLKTGGFILLILSVLIVVSILSIILGLAGYIHHYVKTVLIIYFIYTSLASRCLHEEALKVYRVLKSKDIQKARVQLSYLVGRDTKELNEEEITRGTVETVAENTIDGVLAPMFYIIIGFLIGFPVQLVYIYKTVNTLDSMVGYIQQPYTEIGCASAKFDDVLNYIPARIGSVFMLLGGLFFKYDLSNGFKILIRDRRNHKSPNCGYPEAVAAGLLNIQLGGTNTYFGQKLYKPTIGDKNRNIDIEDIKSAVKIMYSSQALIILVTIIAFYMSN